MFGFLKWGWLRKRVTLSEAAAEKFRRISDLRQRQIVNLTTKLHAVKEELEHAVTKVSLSEFKMRKAQEEIEAIRLQLDQIEQTAAALPGTDSGAGGSVEPTLADISLIMETGSLTKPLQDNIEGSPDPAKPGTKGITSESLALATQIFGMPVEANDLKILRGVDLKVEEILRRAGIQSWLDLAMTKLPALRRIIEDAGPRYRTDKLKTWSVQARMAAKGEWKKLKTYQDSRLGE
jgi:hypothetical protein